MRISFSALLAFFGIARVGQREPQTQTVPATSLKPGALQHAQLTDEQLRRIDKLRATFAEVDESPLETWIENFKRDANPDAELAIWERMARAYQAYCAPRELSVAVKKEVHTLLLLRSMTSEEEALKAGKLKLLSAADAKEVLQHY